MGKESRVIRTCKVVGRRREWQRLQVEKKNNSAKEPYDGY